MANEIGWGMAVNNLIGWGKANEEGYNLLTESNLFFTDEQSNNMLTESRSEAWNGWGEIYDYSWWGDTMDER